MPQRVLLVDGHQDTLDLYKLALDGDGYATDTATTGTAAWEMMGGRRPALMVTEIVLPGMDGFQLIARVRGDDRTRTMPIVVLTTYPPQNLEQYAADMDIRIVLTKPCSPSELSDAVRRSVGGPSAIDSVFPGPQSALPASHIWHARKRSGC